MRDVHLIRNIDHILIKNKTQTWPTVCLYFAVATCYHSAHRKKNINWGTNHLSEPSCTEVNIDSVRDESGSENKHSVEICSAPVCFLCPCSATTWHEVHVYRSQPADCKILVMESKWTRPSEWRGWVVALTKFPSAAEPGFCTIQQKTVSFLLELELKFTAVSLWMNCAAHYLNIFIISFTNFHVRLKKKNSNNFTW